jgi:hypothetical protein
VNLGQMARMLGRRGGQVRASRLSAQERRRIASEGGRARSASLQAARRIVANLRYAALVLELQDRSTRVRRLRAFAGPLPGIYPGQG